MPCRAKLLINRHHYAQAQAARAGIGFTALDNGFAACDDFAGLQAICDSLTEDKIEALARKWLAILPSPYSPAGLGEALEDFGFLAADGGSVGFGESHWAGVRAATIWPTRGREIPNFSAMAEWGIPAWASGLSRRYGRCCLVPHASCATRPGRICTR